MRALVISGMDQGKIVEMLELLRPGEFKNTAGDKFYNNTKAKAWVCESLGSSLHMARIKTGGELAVELARVALVWESRLKPLSDDPDATLAEEKEKENDHTS